MSNPRVAPHAIEQTHRQRTRPRCALEPVVLCVQDFSQLDFTSQPAITGLSPIGDGGGRGLVQHSCLAVTPAGGVLGLRDQHWFQRPQAPKGETRRQQPEQLTPRQFWRILARQGG